jgi:hypothetical protein
MALMALRGRRAIPARQELTGHRVLMVLKAILGLLELTVSLVLMALRVILGPQVLTVRRRMR